jgi:hypothetical protein
MLWYEQLPANQGFSYRDLFGQDKWLDTWTPTRTSWTDVGTPTVTARFRVVGRQCFVQIRVVPATTVATVAGTSYVSLPIAAAGLTGAFATTNRTTNVAIGLCSVDVTNSRVYVPAQLATGNTLEIAGWYEV